jgi:riboflavin biosynthesis pyrimidine reductase
MIVRGVFPTASDPIVIEDADARARLSTLYERTGDSWVRVNLVGSVSGSAAGQDDTSETLTNRVDRKILGVIRRSGDVVLVGAESVRAEGYQLPRTAPLAIVSGSGILGGTPIVLAPDRHVPIILCPERAVDAANRSIPGAIVVIVPDTDGQMTAIDIIAALRGRGLNRIVCEGGPSLAGQLFDGGFVDELCLSTSPVLGGVVLPLLGTRPIETTSLELIQLLVDDSSTIYARWQVRR